MAEDENTLEWRSVQGFPDYEVSQTGVVRRSTPDKRGLFGGQIIGPKPKSGGYLYVGLRDKTSKRHFLGVHRIVAFAFHGDPPSSVYHAAHRDHNPKNNNSKNIHWRTPKQNSVDRWENNSVPHGDNHQWSILTEREVTIIKDRLKNAEKPSVIAQEYSVHEGTIEAIKRGLTWRWMDQQRQEKANGSGI